MKNINYYENKAAYEVDENRPVNESTVSSVGDGTGVIFSGKNVLVDKSGAGVGDILVFDKADSMKKFIKYGTFHAATLPATIVTIGVVWKKTEDKVYIISKKNETTQRWAQGYKSKLSGFNLEAGGDFTITVNSTTTENIVYGAGSTLADMVNLIRIAINAGANDTALNSWTVKEEYGFVTIEHNRHAPNIGNVTVTDSDDNIIIENIVIDYQTILSGLIEQTNIVYRIDGSYSSYAGANFSKFYDYYYANGADTGDNQAVGSGNPLKFSRYNLTDNPDIVNYYGEGEDGYKRYIAAKMIKYPYPKGMSNISKDGKGDTNKLAGAMFVDVDETSKPCYPAAYVAKNTITGSVEGYTTGLEWEWWLPSAIELYEITKDIPLDLSDKINMSLKAIGGTTVSPSTTHWTSSEYSSSYAWSYRGTYGSLFNNSKYGSYSVWAVTAF